MDELEPIKAQLQHLYKRALVAELAVYEENYDDFIVENQANAYRQRQYIMEEALEAFPGGAQNWIEINQSVDGTRWVRKDDENGATYFQQVDHPERVLK